MGTQSNQRDMFEMTEDAYLAERLMQTCVQPKIIGMFRTPDQYVNSECVAEILVAEVGIRNVVEFCVTELERRSANEKG
jgi:hypothetical protein